MPFRFRFVDYNNIEPIAHRHRPRGALERDKLECRRKSESESVRERKRERERRERERQRERREAARERDNSYFRDPGITTTTSDAAPTSHRLLRREQGGSSCPVSSPLCARYAKHAQHSTH